MKNTAIKFGLDQTLGAIFNNSAFLVAIRLMRGGSLETCITALREVRSLVCFVIFGTLTLLPPVRFQSQRNIESILAVQSANTLGDAIGALANLVRRVQTMAPRKHSELYHCAGGEEGSGRQSCWPWLGRVLSLEDSHMSLSKLFLDVRVLISKDNS